MADEATALPSAYERGPALDDLPPRIVDLPISKIREVANRGMQMADAFALWFGESDLPTPEFIRAAAKEALDAGDTFYQPNRGIDPLIDRIAAYMSDLYGASVKRERIIVTCSGMNALMLSYQAVVNPGDVVVTVEPQWPNIRSAAEVVGARIEAVPLAPRPEGWRLDLERIMDAAQNACAITFASPGNPSGWMMSADDQRALLDFARERGIWLIVDEVYARIVYAGRAAPSFVQLAEDEDRVIVVNSFSKAWAMTGWRLGWLTAPLSLGSLFEKLMEYNVAGPAGFVQRAGVRALDEGEDFVRWSVARYGESRDVVIDRLSGLDRVMLPRPAAAFYAFFSVAGVNDTLSFALRLLEETRVGLAPGAAFGEAGHGFLRICYAHEPKRIADALDRLVPHLR